MFDACKAPCYVSLLWLGRAVRVVLGRGDLARLRSRIVKLTAGLSPLLLFGG